MFTAKLKSEKELRTWFKENNWGYEEFTAYGKEVKRFFIPARELKPTTPVRSFVTTWFDWCGKDLRFETHNGYVKAVGNASRFHKDWLTDVVEDTK